MSMIVAAVRVVVMVAVMPMTVIMTVRMMAVIVVVIMARVTMMAGVAMIVAMMIVAVTGSALGMGRGVGRAARIGPAFGIERRFDLSHPPPELADHILDHVVPANAQAPARDLGRQMAIAEMPGDTHQMLRIGAANFNQRLRRRHHLDQPAILQHQRIAATQRHRFLEVEQEFQAARAGHRQTPPVPIVEIEHHGIGGRLGPGRRRQHLDGADHWDVLTGLSL
jgi:hypothetical protein